MRKLTFERGEEMGLIREIMVRDGIKVSEVAERVGISRQAMYKRIQGDMKVSSFLGIMRAMGYEVYYGKDGKVKRIDRI